MQCSDPRSPAILEPSVENPSTLMGRGYNLGPDNTRMHHAGQSQAGVLAATCRDGSDARGHVVRDSCARV